jgi:hypothetical protein
MPTTYYYIKQNNYPIFCEQLSWHLYWENKKFISDPVTAIVIKKKKKLKSSNVDLWRQWLQISFKSVNK